MNNQNKIMGIYKITNKTNNKMYIGESIDIEKRWKEHKISLNNDKHRNYKLQEDWNIYGEDNFTFEILEEILDFEIESLATYLVELESKYMIECDTINIGYNIENTLDKIELINAQKSNNNFVKLPNSIYDNLNISNEAVTILTLMYRNYIHDKSLAICSIQMICDYMRVDTSNNRKTITAIRNAILELINKGYIGKLYNLYYKHCDDSGLTLPIDNIIKNKDSIFYVELNNLDTSYFKVYDNDINNIFKYLQNKKLNKYSLIRYFIACRRVSNNSNNFGYLAQSKLKTLVTDSRTIQKYNIILQDELNLIRYNNSYLTTDNKYCITYIGEHNDKINFNRQLRNEILKNKLIYTDKIKSNKRRSIKQQMNNASENEIEELEIEYESLKYETNKENR